MMDFDNILSIATQNQGGSGGQKRYSLQAGPPKKDPRSKGVNPAAIQALLKKQQKDAKKMELEKKKQKGDLLAKRVELKSDRKARAMASRTKDNFKGYNGIPVVEVPTKRRSKHNAEEEEGNAERFRNYSVDPEDDEDNFEYEPSDSEPEPEPEPVRPSRPNRPISGGSKPSSKKPSGPAKPAMNFADLLKLAEQKQFEPVELKAKVVRKDERLRTADEIRELEMERKAKRRDKDPKPERERDHKSQPISGSGRKNTAEKEHKNCKPQKSSERPSQPSGTGKKPHHTPTSDRGHSSKPSVGDRERDRPRTSQSDRERPKMNTSGSSGAINRVHSKATPSQVSAKQGGPKSTTSHKPSISSDLTFKKESSSSLQSRHAGIPGSRPPNTSAMGQKSQHSRPIQGSSQKQGPTVSGHRSLKGEPPRSGSNSSVKSNPAARTSIGGPPKAGNRPQARPGGALQAKVGGVPQGRLQGHPGGSGVRPPGLGPGQARNGGGPIPGRPAGSLGSGPGRPKCTVVSETISSKNVGRARPGMAPRPGMPGRPGMAPRGGMHPGMMNRPVPMLPPITSAYKRKYEEEEDEYDPEMDDFIDDGEDDGDEISKHIKEIFGYDRNRYRDESDYALKFMESSWRDLQKEEARSLKLAVQEDLEEERKEQEEMKRKSAKREKLH